MTQPSWIRYDFSKLTFFQRLSFHKPSRDRLLYLRLMPKGKVYVLKWAEYRVLNFIKLLGHVFQESPLESFYVARRTFPGEESRWVIYKTKKGYEKGLALGGPAHEVRSLDIQQILEEFEKCGAISHQRWRKIVARPVGKRKKEDLQEAKRG